MKPTLRFALLLSLVLSLASLPSVEPVIAQTPTSAVRIGQAAVAPEETTLAATPSIGQQIAGTADDWARPAKAINGLVLEVIKLAGLGVGLTIAGWSVVWFFRRRPHELIVPKFTNASGDEELDKIADNLSQQGRDELVFQLTELRKHITRHWERAGTPGLRPINPALDALDRSQMPKEIRDQRISNLIDSVADVAPADSKQFIQLLHTVTPPRGTRITVTMLRKMGGPGAVGIGMEFTDLNGEPKGGRRIVWEAASTNTGKEALGSSPTIQEQFVRWLAKRITPENEKKPPSLGHRYEALLPVAARWLAYQMTEAEFLRSDWRILPHRKPEHEAQVHYFLGVFKGGEGRSGGPYTFFFDEGLVHCRKALERCKHVDKHWFRPHQCVADTMLERGRTLDRETPSVDPGRPTPGAKDYADAIEHYTEAQRLVTAELTPLVLNRIWLQVNDGQLEAAEHLIEEEGLTGAQRWVEEARPFFEKDTSLRPPDARLSRPTNREVELRSARNALAVGRATALLLLGGATYTRQAVEEIEQVTLRDLSSEPIEVVLIDLAIWHAFACGRNLAALSPVEARRRARRYLAYGLAKDKGQGYWDWVSGYPDLHPVMDKDDLAKVVLLLTEALRLDPDLCGKSGPAFVEPLEHVLKEAEWLD